MRAIEYYHMKDKMECLPSDVPISFEWKDESRYIPQTFERYNVHKAV